MPSSRKLLSDDLRARIETLHLREAGEREAAEIVGRLDETPLTSIARVDAEIRAAFWKAPLPVPRYEAFFRSDTQWLAELVSTAPSLAFVLLSHGIGRLREAALDQIRYGVPSAHAFALLVLRLNDWSSEVRRAASACAERCFPLTVPEIVASAAFALNHHLPSWRRWTSERTAYDAALAREDVVAVIVERSLGATRGPLGSLLRIAMRSQALDQHLERLATSAVSPTVRATALAALIDRKARWPQGREWRWIDRVYNLGRWEPTFGERSITNASPRERWIAIGAEDRSGAVRKVAAQGLIDHRTTLTGVEPILGALQRDPKAFVRVRADFAARHFAKGV